MWMAIQGRLTTQDRHPEKHLRCSLCGIDADVLRDFYKKFYNSLGRVPNRCSSSIGKTRGLLSFSRGIACVYLIWNERNKRLFTNDKKDSNELIAEVVNHIRLKLVSLTIKTTCQTEEQRSMSYWNFLSEVNTWFILLSSFSSRWPCTMDILNHLGFLDVKGKMNLEWQGKLGGIDSHERWDFLVLALLC
ncbi:hypothetical protein Tco_0723240 [Tanacetum coccineum]